MGRNFSPARKVRSITLPSLARLSLVRTKAPPLPGLTCWNSTILKIVPSTSMWAPFLNWLVLITTARLERRRQHDQQQHADAGPAQHQARYCQALAGLAAVRALDLRQGDVAEDDRGDRAQPAEPEDPGGQRRDRQGVGLGPRRRRGVANRRGRRWRDVRGQALQVGGPAGRVGLAEALVQLVAAEPALEAGLAQALGRRLAVGVRGAEL